MIENYFNSKNTLHNRIYRIIHMLDNFEFEAYSDYLIDDIQQTEESLLVRIGYAEPYETYTDTKRFILPNDLFTEEFHEEKVISFWKDYIKQEEIFEIKHTLEKTLLGLSDNLLKELSDLNVDISRLKEYSYRNEILNKLTENIYEK